MREVATEAIVLTHVRYRDDQWIIKMLTLSGGIVSVMSKGMKQAHLRSLVSPLSRLEVVYLETERGLYKLQEATLIESYYFLRTRWEYLDAAGRIASSICALQCEGKPAPLLYQLMIACLKQIPHCQNSSIMVLFFHLKLYMHEGLISWERHEVFPFSCSLSTWEMLKQIALSTTFPPLYTQACDEALVSKIEALYRGNGL